MSADIVPFRQNEPPTGLEWAALLDDLRPDHRELLRLILRAPKPDPPGDDGPDAPLIELCNKLTAFDEAHRYAGEVIPDDDERDHILAPIFKFRFEVVARVRELDGPTTPEGARAVAAVLLTFYPSGVDPQDPFSDWLAETCAEYLTRGAPA